MRMLPLLTAAAILLAVSASMAIKLPIVVATATQQPAAMSIEEIQQQIDVKSLPALEIENLF
jgi:hypothetical protein